MFPILDQMLSVDNQPMSNAFATSDWSYSITGNLQSLNLINSDGCTFSDKNCAIRRIIIIIVLVCNKFLILVAAPELIWPNGSYEPIGPLH